MNPNLEQEDARHDFHERFIPLVASGLGSQLRPRYIVKIDEHIFVHELAAETRRSIGRAHVTLGRTSQAIASEPASATVTGLLEAPARVRLPAVDHERLSYVEILDRRNRELVTVVELLRVRPQTAKIAGIWPRTRGIRTHSKFLFRKFGGGSRAARRVKFPLADRS